MHLLPISQISPLGVARSGYRSLSGRMEATALVAGCNTTIDGSVGRFARSGPTEPTLRRLGQLTAPPGTTAPHVRDIAPLQA